MRNKIRNFLNLSLFVLFVFHYSFVTAGENVVAIAKKITPSVVSVMSYDERGKALSQGSGFFINAQGDVITNLHILRNARRAEIKTSEDTVYPVKVVLAVDKKNDLILLSVNLPQQKVVPLSLSSSVPKEGEKIAVVFKQIVSEGIVSAVEDIPGAGRIIRITAPLTSGLSGSPVVNMRGEVIGIATLQTAQGKNLNAAVPNEEIAKLISRKPAAVSAGGQGNPPVAVSPGEDPFVSGMKFFKTARFDEARAYFEKAVKQDPKKSEAYFYIGLCYGTLGRFNEEIKVYKQAIKLKQDYADAHNNLGLAYGNLGRNQEAIEEFKQAISLKPDNAFAHFNLGLAYGNLGRNQEAIEEFKQAISLKADYAEVYNNLGSAYGNLDRNQEAIEEFRQAISLKPYYASAHLNLGLVYVSLGNKDSAREEYKILKKISPQQADKLLNAINH